MVQRYITMHNNVRQLGELYTGYNQDFVQYSITDNDAIYYKVMPEFQRNCCPAGYFIIKEYSPGEKDRLPGTGTTGDFIYD
jgi:hypothetical protein